ncbi:MAG TPA: hypothetical protein VM008_05430 [Phycisphaerae bacterium]|nr:hypothetical protein [Phycisphaerae bacterium]
MRDITCHLKSMQPVLAAALLALCGAAHAQSVMTTTYGFAGELYGYGKSQNNSDSGYIPGGYSSHNSAATWDDQSTTVIDNLVVTFKQHSTISATSTVNQGQLHLLVEASSNLSPSEFDYIDDGGTPISVRSPLIAVAGGSATASMLDTITITSPTLPAGTPVDFHVSTTLHVNITSPAYGNADASTSVLFYKPGYSYTDDTGNSYFGFIDRHFLGTNLSQDVEQTSDILHTFVGDSFTVELDGSASATGDADASRPSGYALADAGNTAFFNLDPLTPGATYTTDSGLSYLSPAPEPASLATLALAALPLLRRTRR